MPIYEFSRESIRPLDKTTFAQMQFHERRDLQRLLREDISVITPDTLVIAEEFGDWDKSLRRIDLLGVDTDANLVVIELKRTEDGGHMELQALRYAAMVSTMTFDQAVAVFGDYLQQIGGQDTDARAELLDFLGWDDPAKEVFAPDVRMVLASADFSAELTTSVLWLNERGLDVRCVRLQPYARDGRAFVDVQRIIPLPEADDYQVRVRKKARREREARAGGADHTRYDLTLGGQQLSRLPKNRAIYETFRYLVVEKGVAPEKVAKHFGTRARRKPLRVAGEVGHGEFLRLANQVREAEGRKPFRPQRYFCADEELVRIGGGTYAFYNGWSDPDWTEAMTSLCEAFPDQGITFSPSE